MLTVAALRATEGGGARAKARDVETVSSANVNHLVVSNEPGAAKVDNLPASDMRHDRGGQNARI